MGRINTLSSVKTPKLFRKPFFKFISNRSGPFDHPITLDRTRIYIVPNKSGLVFSILLILLLVGSVNYDKSLGFVLTFLLVGIGNVGLMQTWKNLAGLKLSAGGCRPVFLGEQAIFAVQVQNTDKHPKYSLTICHRGKAHETIDVLDDKPHYFHFEIKTKQRGYLNPEHFRVETEFPMGLFVAWTVLDLSMRCLVYPKPSATSSLDSASISEEGEKSTARKGTEEFGGLKKYQQGESWRHISWKAMARNDELYTKEFTGGQPQKLWVDWNEINASDTETKLSMMSRMLVDAEEQGSHYGLRLPGLERKPDTGHNHLHACLRELALYGL